MWAIRLRQGPLDQQGANSLSEAIRNTFDEGHRASRAVTAVTVFGEEEEREVNTTSFPHHPL